DAPVLLNGDSVTVISIPNALFPTTGGINAQGTIVGYAYTEDFFFRAYLETVTGERDSSRNVHVNQAEKHELQKIQRPPEPPPGIFSPLSVDGNHNQRLASRWDVVSHSGLKGISMGSK